MELIYLWVEQFRNIKKKKFNFSNEFEVTRTEKNISISNKKNNINLFGQKCSSVTALIGANGSGKTSILDLLGVRREERINFSKNDEYFIIYHLNKDIFAVEGKGLHLIENIVLNMPKKSSKIITEPYSFTFQYVDNKLIFKDFLQDNKNLYDSIKYVSFRYNYDNYTYKSSRSFDVDNDYSHLFQRLNLNNQNIGHYGIYKMLVDLNNEESNSMYKMFDYKSIAKINIRLKYNDFNELNELNSKFDFELKKFNKQSTLFKILSKNNSDEKKQNLDLETFETPKFKFLNKFMYGFSYSLIAFYYFDPSTNLEIFLKEFKPQLKKIDKMYGQNPKEYFRKVIEYLLYKLKEMKYLENISDIENVYNNYLNCLEAIDDKYYEKNSIEISINENDTNLINLIKQIDMANFNYFEEVQDMLTVFKISYNPLSSGEKALLSLFAALYFGISNSKNIKKIIILLDEPEQFLHPEWSRLLLKSLIDFLNNMNVEETEYQIIFSTHSPFMISDLTMDNIFMFDNTLNFSDKNFGETFAANIHTLLSKEFFMKSTIGEFAKSKINEALSLLNDEDKCKVQKNRDFIDYIISIVGEPIVKKKMEEMRSKKYLGENEVKEKINELQKQIEELKKYDSNN